MWTLFAAVVFHSVAAACPQSAGSSGGVITEATVTDVRYACRIGGGFTQVVRDTKLPIFVVRVVIGDKISYELYQKPRQQGPGSILLATCDHLVPTDPGGDRGQR
jgi:hypothetical protein